MTGGPFTNSTAIGYNSRLTASGQMVFGTSTVSNYMFRGVSTFWPTANAEGHLVNDASGNLSWGYSMATNGVLAGRIDFSRHNVLTNTSSGFTLGVAIANVPTTAEDSVILNVYNSGSPFSVTTDNTTWFNSDNTTTHWVTNTASFLIVVRPGVYTNCYFSRCQH
jgi:hypothetical protein